MAWWQDATATGGALARRQDATATGGACARRYLEPDFYYLLPEKWGTGCFGVQRNVTQRPPPPSKLGI